MIKAEKDFYIAMAIIIIINIGLIAFLYYDAKKSVDKKQREQATLNYYESVETLLDSLCIDGGDAIFETDEGAKYLESKYIFDSLFINSNYEREH